MQPSQGIERLPRKEDQQDPRRWFIVQTKPQSEEKAAANLRRAGYHVHLPKMRKELFHRKHRRKLGIKYFVLFNRYLFVRVKPGQGMKAIPETEGVHRVLQYCGPNGPEYVSIPRKEVRDLIVAQRQLLFDDTLRARKLRGQNRKSEAEAYAGQHVRILDGKHPLAGLFGPVASVTEKGKMVISALIDIMGRMVPTELEPSSVEIVSPTGEHLDAAALAA